MSNIVQLFPAGRNRKKADISAANADARSDADSGVSQSDEAILEQEAEWTLQNRPIADAAVIRVVTFRRFTQSLRGQWFNPDSAKTVEQALMHSSYRELCEIMVASEERDWLRRPAYYVAVDNQMVERQQMLIPYLQAHDKSITYADE